MIELLVVPHTVPSGSPVDITVRLVNRGSGPCRNVRMVLGLSTGLELRRGLRRRRLPVLAPGARHDEHLVVVATAPGEHVVRILDLSYQDARGESVRRRDVTLAVHAGGRAGPTPEAPSTAPSPPRCACGSIFVNYRRVDSMPTARRLARDLPVPTGHRVFHDHTSLRGGQDFRARLAAELSGSAALLAVIGPVWLTTATPSGRRRIDCDDDLVRHEIRVALEQADTVVIPVLVGGVPVPSRRELPGDIASLADQQVVSFRSPADLRRLVTEVRRACRRRA